MIDIDREAQRLTEEALSPEGPNVCPVCGHMQVSTNFQNHFQKTDEEWGTQHHEAWSLASGLVSVLPLSDPTYPLAVEVLEAIEDWDESGEKEFRAADAVLFFIQEYDARQAEFDDLLRELAEAEEAEIAENELDNALYEARKDRDA